MGYTFSINFSRPFFSFIRPFHSFYAYFLFLSPILLALVLSLFLSLFPSLLTAMIDKLAHSLFSTCFRRQIACGAMLHSAPVAVVFLFLPIRLSPHYSSVSLPLIFLCSFQRKKSIGFINIPNSSVNFNPF